MTRVSMVKVAGICCTSVRVFLANQARYQLRAQCSDRKFADNETSSQSTHELRNAAVYAATPISPAVSAPIDPVVPANGVWPTVAIARLLGVLRKFSHRQLHWSGW